MSDINWKEESVCRAMMMQWKEYSNSKLISDHDTILPYDGIYDIKDFQLNEIRTGDYIPASELYTEQKYNDVVDALKLCGVTGGLVECIGSYSTFKNINKKNQAIVIHDVKGELCAGIVPDDHHLCIRRLHCEQIIAIGKLKRMMLEREKSGAISGADLTADFTKASSNKYEREITDRQGNSATVDVYDVIIAYGVTCPATQHAIKKLLCTGDRGHKDTLTDLSEARDAITRAIELN